MNPRRLIATGTLALALVGGLTGSVDLASLAPPGAAAVAVTLMGVPAGLGALMWLGLRRTAGLFGLVGGYALVVESLALRWGWPYGTFEYGPAMAPLIPSGAPAALPLAYVPLVLGSLAMALWTAPQAVGRGVRLAWVVAAGTGWMLAFDLVLDPGAVAASYWNYIGGGAYYEVPVSNYIGWLLTSPAAIAGALSMASLGARTDPPPPLMTASALWGTAFWAGFAVVRALWLPALIGIVLCAAMLLATWQPSVQGAGPSGRAPLSDRE